LLLYHTYCEGSGETGAQVSFLYHESSVSECSFSEHEQAKEQAHQVLRIAERTLALPYGRAMLTFGSLQNITRESFVVPKMEFTVRLAPMNTTVAPEPGKIIADAIQWGEFHNGVASGLRISITAESIDNSWIAFNKPSDLTPEHAGLLYALGLTGHLKAIMHWHMFAYLTPKHDLTSIALLLGLATANIGNANQQVTKVLAVHTPALLPTPDIDLNVSLMTQAAGLSGVGILYMGTKNRKMAERCLQQISRHDLAQPDISNEYREAYTTSAALAFGMIMLGKGSNIPADMLFVERLQLLIHGARSHAPTPFDVNLTSPVATLALGLMYLRTERKDIADIVEIPDTVLAMNNIQPQFLLMRIIAKCLILWNDVQATPEWLGRQLPTSVRTAIEARFKTGTSVDDALELAYYNIIAGCCFILGLKFAGTANEKAYRLVIRYYDLYTRMTYGNGEHFTISFN
jgi:anaphase-promoting complex subunit 1